MKLPRRFSRASEIWGLTLGFKETIILVGLFVVGRIYSTAGDYFVEAFRSKAWLVGCIHLIIMLVVWYLCIAFFRFARSERVRTWMDGEDPE